MKRLYPGWPIDPIQKCYECNGIGYFESGKGNWSGEGNGTHAMRKVLRQCTICLGKGYVFLPKSEIKEWVKNNTETIKEFYT